MPRSTAVLLLALAGCAGSDEAPDREPSTAAGSEDSEVLPLGATDPASFAVFTDAATGFMTVEVHDADREVVHFDAGRRAMLSAATGELIQGWSVEGEDLDWISSAATFRVRFGTEQGERRAYFTERGPGTICNLRFAGSGLLSISATSERPPDP